MRQLGRIAVSGAEAKAAEELLDFVGLGLPGPEGARLSYGQQKLVELAQVLMLEPKVILLDEPAGGINPILLERMADMIRELNRYGMTFLVVEHNIPLVLELCDPVARAGARQDDRRRALPDEIQHDPLVLDAYLGDDWLPAIEPQQGARP